MFVTHSVPEAMNAGSGPDRRRLRPPAPQRDGRDRRPGARGDRAPLPERAGLLLPFGPAVGALARAGRQRPPARRCTPGACPVRCWSRSASSPTTWRSSTTSTPRRWPRPASSAWPASVPPPPGSTRGSSRWCETCCSSVPPSSGARTRPRRGRRRPARLGRVRGGLLPEPARPASGAVRVGLTVRARSDPRPAAAVSPRGHHRRGRAARPGPARRPRGRRAGARPAARRACEVAATKTSDHRHRHRGRPGERGADPGADRGGPARRRAPRGGGRRQRRHQRRALDRRPDRRHGELLPRPAPVRRVDRRRGGRGGAGRGRGQRRHRRGVHRDPRAAARPATAGRCGSGDPDRSSGAWSRPGYNYEPPIRARQAAAVARAARPGGRHPPVRVLRARPVRARRRASPTATSRRAACPGTTPPAG